MTEEEPSPEWRPLGLDGPQRGTYDALHEGVPSWLYTSLWNWIVGRFTRLVKGSTWTERRFVPELLREAERVCRFSAPYAGTDVGNGRRALQVALSQDADGTLRLVDFLLARSQGDGGLEVVLSQAGSAWRVGTRSGKQGLLRRVPSGVQEAADAVMVGSGHAGERLARAWEAAFGIEPNPSVAYALAIKAVEDAAAAVVTPLDSRATLGKMTGVVGDQADWRLPFAREEATVHSGAAILAMMQALWTGQSDRHGGDPNERADIAQEAAESAVLLAVPLVYWFSTGHARRA